MPSWPPLLHAADEREPAPIRVVLGISVPDERVVGEPEQIGTGAAIEFTGKATADDNVFAKPPAASQSLPAPPSITLTLLFPILSCAKNLRRALDLGPEDNSLERDQWEVACRTLGNSR